MMTSTTCGSEPIISMKRSPPSPDDPSSLLGFGYSKLTLPLNHHHQPLLRRCISDPYSPPPPPPQTNPFLSAGHFPDLNPPKTTSPSPTHFNSSLPPRAPPQKPPTFRRSVSDLNPSPAQAFSRSSSSNDMVLETDTDTPNSKRLKRMKGRLKEMSEWCRQLMQEEDLQQDDDDEELEIGAAQDMPDIDAIRDIPNDTSTEDSSEKEFSESVSVEKKDDSLVIHFRCHCDKAYQFLLNGSDCYYKLL